jgi:hypothetical protein
VKKLDVIGSLVLIGVSIFVCMEAIRMSLGSFRSPGPGLYPLILGLILGIFAILLGLSVLFRHDGQKKRTSTASNMGQVWAIIVTLLIYSALLPLAGYSVATFLLLASLFQIGGIRSWIYSGSLAVIFTLTTEGLAIVFGIPLPRGNMWRHLFPQLFSM